jgi:hypothetical protein
MTIRTMWMAASLLLAAAMGVRAQQPAAGLPALDYDVFKTRVQPIFLARRDGHARCVNCHVNLPGVFGGAMRLQPLAKGSATWTEEQSKQNFESVRRVAAAANPDQSRLLLMPLAEEAGGTEFHSGGKHFDTKADPEWQTLAAWVRGR